MAITIRNKETEAMIRKIGKRRGEGPSAVIRYLAEKEVCPETQPVSREEIERRIRIFRELEREFPPPSEEEKEQIQYELDHMYDYLYQDEKG